MEEILKKVQNGTLSIEDAKKKLATYEDLGFAKVDHHRKQRQGFPEVIYGEGKTVEQIIAILQAIKAKQNDILITRISPDKADKILEVHLELTYHDMAQILSLKVEEKREEKEGYIAILCAGTSDLRIAEEAAVTAEALGSNVRRFYDVGVAGIHRLLDPGSSYSRRNGFGRHSRNGRGASKCGRRSCFASSHCCADKCGLWCELSRSVGITDDAELLCERNQRGQY